MPDEQIIEQNKLRIAAEEPLSAEHALVGSVIAGKYELRSILGRGAMGLVYLARHLELGKQVAVKVLPASMLLDEKAQQRFFREAKLASALNHANVIAVHDYGRMEDGAPYLVMDYAPGRTLSSLLQEEGTLSKEKFVEIFKQVCAGLGHAHSKGLVHRDVKPSNIIVDDGANGCTAKIVDFGIARGAEFENALTATGNITGTPFYLSPEQCTGNQVDGRADLYAMGCVMFQAMTGSVPFSADSALGTIYLHVNEPPPTLGSLRPDLAAEFNLQDLISCLLAKDADQRFRNAEEVIPAIDAVLQPSSRKMVGGDPPSAPDPELSRRRKNLKLLLGGFTLFMLGVLAVCAGVVLTDTLSSQDSTTHSRSSVVDDKAQVSISYPKNWEPAKLEGEQILHLRNDKGGQFADLAISCTQTEMTADQVSKILEVMLASGQKDFRPDAPQRETWAGIAGVRRDCTWTAEGKPLTMHTFCFREGKNVYSIVLATYARDAQPTKKLFEKMLLSLQFR
jgi:serine/threonine protein kinase